MSQRPRVAVIGAGLGGLAAARALRARGDVDVVIYEAGATPGGVVRTSSAAGFLREHAANGVLGTPGGVVDLARDLGVTMAEAAPAARKRWIYRHGALRALPASPGALIRTDLISWRGKLAALAEPLRPVRAQGAGPGPGSGAGPGIDIDAAGDETVAAFVRRRLGPEIADAVVAPFVTGVFAGRSEELSVASAFPFLVELERQGGLVRGLVRRQLAALKGRVTARLSGRARGQAEGWERGRDGGQAGPGEAAGRKRRMRLSAPVGGMDALVRALAASLGNALELDTAVASVAPDADGVRIALARGEVVHARAAVLATPAHVSARLVRDASAALAAVLDEIPYVPAAIVHLGFERARIAHPLDGFGFLVAEGEDLRVLGTVFESVLWPDRAPAGQVLLRCIYGGGRDPGVLALDDDALVATAREDLQRALGIDQPPVHSNVVRWPKAIPQYTPGHGARVARAEALAAPMGLVLGGSAYRSVALNGLVADAGRVVEAVLARLQGALALLIVLCGLWSVACAGNGHGAGGEAGGAAAGKDGALRAAESAESPAGGSAGDQAPGQAPGQAAGAPGARAGEAGDAAAGRTQSAVDQGGLRVTVTWPDAPAAVRRSSGRNACGAARQAPVVVHTLGGVQGAVVAMLPAGTEAEADTDTDSEADTEAEAVQLAQPTAKRPAAPAADAVSEDRAKAPFAEIALQRCQALPRVTVLAHAEDVLAIVNQDERRHRVRIELLGSMLEAASADAPAAGADTPARASLAHDIELPLVGSRVDLTVTEPSILRVGGTAEPAYVLASPRSRAVVTDDAGLAELAQVPAGRYQVLAWHPPLREGEAPLQARAPVTVEAGRVTRVSIALADR